MPQACKQLDVFFVFPFPSPPTIQQTTTLLAERVF